MNYYYYNTYLLIILLYTNSSKLIIYQNSYLLVYSISIIYTLISSIKHSSSHSYYYDIS